MLFSGISNNLLPIPTRYRPANLGMRADSFTALLLMYSIDSALNTIWRSKRAQPKIYQFAVYWIILTLGRYWQGPVWRSVPLFALPRWASDLNTVIDNVLRIFRCCCRGSPSGCCTALFQPSAYLTATRLSARLLLHSCSKQERKVSRFISPCSRHISSFTVCWR